ncbi:hypothetical protein O181_047512 [Austropuccinia psidii MF-1]|uniref:Uncharacterized protein n=1 Tax=Austropuccinia psidii MF-1 TaxID=1389203 RepID=A0A9Q3DXZ2_9BASI|nr:hypothetical protein [Austropuccinia psidii MF-1]
MASLQEYQNYKTHQEAFRRMVGTFLSLVKSWNPCISPQVFFAMEVSSPCLPCVITKPVKKSSIPKRNQVPPPPILVEEKEEWEVSQALDSKLTRGWLW